MTHGNPWVDFEDPPVTEVVVSVAFSPLKALTVAHMGLFWEERLRDFPLVEEKGPYDPPVERFDGPARGLSLSVGTGPPLPRLWFKTPDDQELVQLQRDWLACNWRKVGREAEYARWPSRREAFRRTFSSFIEFLHARQLGAVRPVQCEVTYVNHIAPSAVWEHHGQLHRVMTLVSPPTDFLPDAEQSRVQSQYVIRHSDEPVGRLHVQCDPVVDRKDETPAFALNLTARGRPLDESLEGVLAFLDLGREWVTRGFKAVTTNEMHDVWGMRDV